MWHKLKEVWNLLNKSIYTGERLRQNLFALTLVSLFCALLGLYLMVVNIIMHESIMFIAATVTFLSGVGCAYLAGVKKNREKAILIPTLFCIFAFTIYAVMGNAEGSAMLWSLLAPLGLCYFVSVRNGIIVSVYFSAFYFILFYTPLRAVMEPYYREPFLIRFPLVYFCLTVFTAISMIQYHRGVLLEIEYTDRLNEEVAKQTAVAEARSRKIEQMSYQTIQTLANAIDAKDPYTKGHSIRVSLYSVKIAEALGWDKERISNLRYAALLHDIGKIGVPDSILNNPKKLTDAEYDIIKSHTTTGSEILRDKIMIESADDVALSHHEHYDGTGYPRGLKGEEISEESRIVAIADAFDAMNSSRVYRKVCTREYIMNELTEGRGKQFDPKFADCFIVLWKNGDLDSIMQTDVSVDPTELEASSVLLQEIMDTFLSQVAADETDIITGTLNRAAGEAAIANALQENEGCFVFIDVDNLKKINDVNGHEAGDRVLRLTGTTLNENSENAIACRMGGDEFLFFMKNVTRDEAEKRIQKIIDSFEQQKAKDIEITVASLSAGAVMCQVQEPFGQVYNKADKALYFVKQNGKSGYSFFNKATELSENLNVDINRLIRSIQNSGSYEGAMDVEYRQFVKLYEYVCNLEKRFSHPFRLLMISLEADPAELTHPNNLEKSMACMEQAIRQAIRNVDVLTRYNRQCFLIILNGTGQEGVKPVIDRIFRGYYKMNGSSIFTPSYVVADSKGKESA